MRRFALGFAILLALGASRALGESAPVFSKAASGAPTFVQAGPERAFCPVCGMSLKAFFKTSHAAHLHDGSARQFCSLRCLVADHARVGAGGARIEVVDAQTEALVPADTAHYVLDSAVPGTMSAVSKIAFAERAHAEAFARAHGGRIVSFAAAREAARGSLEADTERLRTRKRLKVHPMGKKLWETACRRRVDPARFDSIARFKAALVAASDCAGLDGKKLQAVALYVWEVLARPGERLPPIVVPPDARCPVCGMFVARYPNWVARATLVDGTALFFDGVKDLLKFLVGAGAHGFPTGTSTDEIYFTDYYTLAGIEAHLAFLVFGSDVLGPMGHELVPFATRAHAETFLADHGGEKILRMQDVTPALLEALDARK